MSEIQSEQPAATTSNVPQPSQPNTPWHLWVVGIVSLLWNAMGGLDFTMTMSKNEEYMSAFTEEQLEYFYSFPSWMIAFWGVAVWGSILGSLLLLFRSKLSFPVFLLSFVSMVVTTIYNFGMTNGLEMMGIGGAIFSAIIFVIAALLVYYSRVMVRTGVLR